MPLELILQTLKEWFSHIIVIDYEYKQLAGNNPKPVSCVMKDLVTGKTTKQWLAGKKQKFPYSIPDSLFICHYAVAEVSCMIALGLGKPKHIFDTFVEEKKMMNGLIKIGFGLLDTCERYGVKGLMSDDKKEFWRNHIINNYPNYTAEDQEGILKYNEEDVITTEKLFYKQLETLTKNETDLKKIISQAIFHGRSMGVCAQIEHNGIPVDWKLYEDFNKYFPKIKELEIEEINKSCNVYDGDTFSHEKFAKFIEREGLAERWPKTPTGRFKTDSRTFYRFQHIPKIFDLKNAIFIIGARKLKGYQLGEDKRSRTSLHPFGQITGRTNASPAESPFGAPRMIRTIIHPDSDSIEVYCDYGAQEAAVMAFLSGDPKMLIAVKSGDPYLHTAKFVKALPAAATKKSHPDIREKFKTSYLALAYKQTPYGLSAKLGIPFYQAAHIHGNISRAFNHYNDWITGIINNSTLRGYFITKYGWRYNLSNEKNNPKRLANWPVQSCGSEILRMAMIAVDEAGFEISMCVRDALLVHMPRKNCAANIRKLKKIMQDAAGKVIDFKIPVDTKIIRKHFDQENEHKLKWEMLYKKYLTAKECTDNGQ